MRNRLHLWLQSKNMKIYHNPRCRKSRETLELLKSKGHDPEIVLYLDQIPTKKELKNLIEMLGITAQDLLRKSEAIYKEEFKGRELTESKWIDAMIRYPKLIERPIVVHKKKAALGRPPEKVLDIL